MKFWSIILLWALSGSVQAEYRLYQYLIRPLQPGNPQPSSRPYRVISSLDPVSYQSYHGGGDGQEIHLLQSWMCMGHTSDKRPCPSPLDLMPRNPVNSDPENPPPLNNSLSGPS